jgi:membrane peptidoglycan carboxypeptidase
MSFFIAYSIRTINSGFGFVLRVSARVLIRSKWTRLHDQLRSERQSFAYPTCSDMGVLPAALVACEDNRFFEHRGVDLYSVVRACVRLASRHSIEGASTITQQLVRVYTNDYQFNLQRKLREVLLATLVDRHFSKEDQINLYLARAYFGWRMNGLRQVSDRLGYSPPYSAQQAAEIVARLKYPEPEIIGPRRGLQIANRVQHVLSLIRNSEQV